MDVIPITLFIHIYLLSVLRQLLGCDWTKTISLWLNYLLAGIIAQMVLPPDMFNGTIMYIPTYITLILLAWAVRARDAQAGRVLFQMVLLWTISLVFRTIDRDICAQFAFGTHFLWHTLNAWMLYRLLMLLVRRR